ncbi:MAG TPA: hypothetical protein VML01_10030 [Bryobacterales bacterium]|nr:hypothetical protein [Bryobacterales bacterium]
MGDDSKSCKVCDELRDELGDRTFQYVIAGARLQALEDVEQFTDFKTAVEKAQAGYSEARENLIQHYQEFHPDV